MDGPVANIALLLLMILLFGSQQRRSPEMCFRGWFVGWVFTFLAYVLWAVPVTGHWLRLAQDALRFDLVLVGGLAFVLSFLLQPERLRQTVLLGIGIAVPILIGVDLQMFYPELPPRLQMALGPLLVALIVAGQGAGVLTALIDLPREWRVRKAFVISLCGLFGFAMLLRIHHDPTRVLPDLVLGEIFLCTALLYGCVYGIRSIPARLGVVGFGAWALFYVAGMLLLDYGKVPALHILWSIWNTPKYVVGLAMILKVFEDDATQKAQLAEKYRSLYEDFRLMYEAHPHPMWIYEQRTGKCLSANLAAVTDYGYTRQDLSAMRIQDLQLPEEGDVERSHRLPPEGSDGRRARFRRKNGTVLWVNRVDQPFQFQGIDARLLIARDITDRLKAQRRLAYLAEHDVLTGLPNRLLLEERLQQTLTECERSARKAALLSIDIDHFKRINDTYGHPAGDACLQAVAERLKGRIRQIDTLARTGGEEFTAILGGLESAVDAELIATDLLRISEDPLRLPDLEISVTVSIGVALFPDDARDAETLRSISDEALYFAKRSGRNRVAFAPALKSGQPRVPEIQPRVLENQPRMALSDLGQA